MRRRYIVIFSESKRKYLMECGIEPLDGFDDYYENTKHLRDVLVSYEIQKIFWNKF